MAQFKRGDIVLCDAEEAPGWHGLAIVHSFTPTNDVNIIWISGRAELHFHHDGYDAFVPASWLRKLGEVPHG